MRRAASGYAARVEAEDDALVMYLVVRRRTTRPFVELATAAALADPPLRCALTGTTSAGATASRSWWRHSFRKVCLRAEPRDWEAVRELDHERVGRRRVPAARAARRLRDRVLVRMQALSDEAAGSLPSLGGDPADRALTLVVATGLGMSAGKTLAQIGHAALMADLDPDLDRRRRRCRGRRVGAARARRRLRSSGTAASPSSRRARRPCSCSSTRVTKRERMGAWHES